MRNGKAAGEGGRQRALAAAIERGREGRAREIVREAASSGHLALLDQRDSHGSSPIERAMAAGMSDLAVELANAGASLDGSAERGESALGMAIRLGMSSAALKMIGRLGEEGPAGPGWVLLAEAAKMAEGGEHSRKGPLAEAIERGREDVALALLASGAPISRKDLRREPMLATAIEAGMDVAARALARRLSMEGERGQAALRKADKRGMPPLHAAMKRGDEALSMELIGAGASPFGWRWEDDSALGHAISGGMEKLALKIIHTTDAWGRSCLDEVGESSMQLRRSIDQGLEGAAEALVRLGGKIGQFMGSEPLLNAAIDQGQKGVAKALLERAGSMTGRERELLLEGGGEREKSPMALAAEKGREWACRALAAAGANLGKAIQSAQGNPEALWILEQIQREAEQEAATSKTPEGSSRAANRIKSRALRARSKLGAWAEIEKAEALRPRQGGQRRARQ